MKRFLIVFLIFSLAYALFDQFYIFPLMLNYECNTQTKNIIHDEIKLIPTYPYLIAKKNLLQLSYAKLLPQYLKHKLKRNHVIFYVLSIEETSQHIPIQLNHQSWLIANDASIISAFPSSDNSLAPFYLFSIQIHTNIDQMEAYRKYVQDFIYFLLHSENSIGPLIKSILYDESIGLSYLDFKDRHIILGKNPDYNKMLKLLDILSDPRIESKINEQAYDEIDFRFEKKIICRFQSNNSSNNP